MEFYLKKENLNRSNFIKLHSNTKINDYSEFSL